MQSIETKFIAPTSKRQTRIVVKSMCKRLVLGWNYSLGVEGNHDAAAKQLAELLGWSGKWVSANKSDGTGNVYVLLSTPAFEVEA